MDNKFTIHLLRIIPVVLSALIASNIYADTQAVYMPSNYPAERLAEVQNTPNFQAICENLPGLDLARGILNLSMCPGRAAISPATSSTVSERVDLLFLVDDRRELSEQLRTQLTQLNALQNSSGRQTVRPSTHYVRNRDGTFGGRMLVVGESAYTAAGSDASWIQLIQRLAAQFERGSLAEMEDETRDFDVAYDRDYDRFKRNVMDALCRIMLCRSDAREYMQTLIDRHRDLQDLHTNLATTVSAGSNVRLRAIITRQHDREERIADMRFAQSGIQIDAEEESVTGDRRHGVVHVMNESLERARQNTHRIPEPARRERLDCLLTLYNRLGNGAIYDTEREPYSAERFWVANAFDGGDNYEGLSRVPPPPENHRYYPMREIYMASRLTEDDDAEFARKLKSIDNSVYQSWYIFFREDSVAGGAGGQQRYGPNLQRLHDWIMQQQRSINSVYSCYGGTNNP